MAPMGCTRMSTGCRLTPCAAAVTPLGVKPKPMGATFTAVAPATTPVAEYEMRQGAKLTPVAESETPVMKRVTSAAALLNLDGCPTDLPVTAMLYLLSLALSCGEGKEGGGVGG